MHSEAPGSGREQGGTSESLKANTLAFLDNLVEAERRCWAPLRACGLVFGQPMGSDPLPTPYLTRLLTLGKSLTLAVDLQKMDSGWHCGHPRGICEDLVC